MGYGLTGRKLVLPEGKVTRTVEVRRVFCVKENGWSAIGTVDRETGCDVNINGFIRDVSAGMLLDVTGMYRDDPKYGPQIRVETWREAVPATEKGLVGYLSKGTVRGIGPALARRLVEHFGTGLVDVLDHCPGRLREVRGLGDVKVARITEDWKRHRAVSDIMIFLQGHGATPSVASRIYREYGTGASRR